MRSSQISADLGRECSRQRGQQEQRPWGGMRLGKNRSSPLGLTLSSCAERLQSEEQVSKNLFGPPLESAFDHEDFTGDGDKGLEVMGVAGGRMGGAIAKLDQWSTLEARLEGGLVRVRVGGARVQVGGAIDRTGPWPVGGDWVDGPDFCVEGSHQKA